VLTTVDLLDVWEMGLQQLPVNRAVEVLAHALPGGKEAMEKLTIGRRDRLLLDVRERTFGSHMNAVTECTACSARIEMEFETGEIRAAEIAEESEVEMLFHEYRLRLRLPNSRDVMEATTVPIDAGAAKLFERCVVEAQRGDQTVGSRDLPSEVMELAIEKMALADPQADIHLTLQCPVCGVINRAPMDIAAYLWREIEMFAVRVLQEVHELAAAYGWEEQQILQMSPTRRRCYLEMVRT